MPGSVIILGFGLRLGFVFEGYKFPILKCYDYLLKLSYGDYMQLPPKEKRIPHHNYKIYRPRN